MSIQKQVLLSKMGFTLSQVGTRFLPQSWLTAESQWNSSKPMQWSLHCTLRENFAGWRSPWSKQTLVPLPRWKPQSTKWVYLELGEPYGWHKSVYTCVGRPGRGRGYGVPPQPSSKPWSAHPYTCCRPLMYSPESPWKMVAWPLVTFLRKILLFFPFQAKSLDRHDYQMTNLQNRVLGLILIRSTYQRVMFYI